MTWEIALQWKLSTLCRRFSESKYICNATLVALLYANFPFYTESKSKGIRVLFIRQEMLYSWKVEATMRSADMLACEGRLQAPRLNHVRVPRLP
jgi:hypothetical protein